MTEPARLFTIGHSNQTLERFLDLLAAAGVTAVTVAAASLPAGLVGTAYATTTLSAAGGTGSYSWARSAGTLPGGVSLSSAANWCTRRGLPSEGPLGLFD